MKIWLNSSNNIFKNDVLASVPLFIIICSIICSGIYFQLITFENFTISYIATDTFPLSTFLFFLLSWIFLSMLAIVILWKTIFPDILILRPSQPYNSILLGAMFVLLFEHIYWIGCILMIIGCFNYYKLFKKTI